MRGHYTDDTEARVNAYFAAMLGLTVDDVQEDGLYAGESHRRLERWEGYGSVWPVLLLRKGNRWWLSVAPGLLDAVLPVVQAAYAGDGFVTALADVMGKALSGRLDIGVAHRSHQYVPARETPRIDVPEGYTIQPVTPAQKPPNIPDESVAAGTALGAYIDGDGTPVSWVEATPLPTATPRYGVMLVGIETQEGHRRRGLAKALLAELTRRVLDMGRVPLYSCSTTNIASQRTALACGYRLYGETLRLRAQA